ncbi:xaa-Pro dipeptidase-like [Condylostylus longicornis]|uniref:xaa-Pro dipeptidase-like n=1 Tax=Condylostylus longicornis TaxID=2530218 RepID=UPI00244E2F5B|nr:xaa-Pro dipeptidase-like [Condylostylus longicornis]
MTGAVYQMGSGTLAVPMKLFKDNRNRVVEKFKNINSLDNFAYIFLRGGTNTSFNDTDQKYIFRQESYFQYMFGVKEPECYGAINAKTGRSTLFVPRLPAEYAVWQGRIYTLDDFKKHYEVDEVYYTDNMEKFFHSMNTSLILTLFGTNSDSGLQSEPASFPGIEKFKVNSEMLYPIIAECRVLKSPDELEVLRYVAKVSCDAHKRIMKMIRAGMMEYEAESEFLHYCYKYGGCRHPSYVCICPSGANSATLHYGHANAPNNRRIEDGDMCLFDMGANYAGYSSDITCSFPVNGKFTEKQKFIYNAVLDARNAVMSTARDGISWVDMHRLACKTILQRLKEGGVLKGDVDEMMKSGLHAIFMPHGLGHLIGVDVHDVGGYLAGQPERPVEPGFDKLRFARILKAGMYITIEPGCYFIEILMNKAIEDKNLNKFINVEKFEEFRNFGGVRLEDDVLVRENDVENFSIVPRTVEEIEEFMAR